MSIYLGNTLITGANTSLNNLSAAGNTRLQYVPFSVNAGLTDANGNNITLNTNEAGTLLTCAPCTITTTKGQVFTDTETRTLDIAQWDNNTPYVVFKAATNGSLSTTRQSRFFIGKVQPDSVESNVFVDISTLPAKIYRYITDAWVEINVVYIGSFIKSNGLISSVTNVPFNCSNYAINSYNADYNLSNLTELGEAHFQAPLISGANIKTINSNSILGNGNLEIEAGANENLSNLTELGEAHFANPDLQNLSTLGNSRLQYAPFAMNNGVVSSSGKNVTLDTNYAQTSIVCQPCTLTTTDGRTFVDSETRTRDVSAWANNTDYAVFKNVTTNVLSTQKADSFSISKTVPINASIVGNLVNNSGILSNFSTTDYGRIPINFTPANSTWEYCFKFTTGSDVTSLQSIVSDKHCWYSGNYAQRWGVFIYIQNSEIYATANNGVVSGSGNPTFISHTIDVNPNTEYKVRFEFTGTAYNTYVSINGAPETLVQTTTSTTVVTSSGENPYIGITYSQHNSTYYAPFLGSIDLNECYIKVNNSMWWLGTKLRWLDTSTIPANFKFNEGNGWSLSNNLVWIGNFTKTDGTITTVTNRKFNDSGYLVDRHIDGVVETYVNGTSWYRIYSDGWCEQGGRKVGASGQTITLMKPYANTNYHLSGSMLGSAYNTIVAFGIIDSSSFVVHTVSGGQAYNSTASWLACGYLA